MAFFSDVEVTNSYINTCLDKMEKFKGRNIA